ncbi:RecX family transcriptional regulator, partial [bacterium]|nr:RecX family transcriptional regulator [bacterium]
MTKSAPRGSKSPPISAFDAACRSLARRRLTEAEVRQRLEKKYQPSEIAEAVIKLKEYHFIDDDALIVDYIKDRLNLSPRSVRMMQYELLRRGIAQEHFQRIFEQEFPDHDEVEAARQALKSRLKRLQSAPPQSRRERALRFLHSRGFNFEVIN